MLRRMCTARTAKSSLYNSKKYLFSEIIVLVKLLLLAPATNAISECSCSTLRRIKTYLRSKMIQSWLSHCMVFNAHKEALGELSLIERANEFWRKNEARLNIFWKFSLEQIPQHLVVKMDICGNTDFLTYFIAFYFWLFLCQSTSIKLHELLEGLFIRLQYLK